MDTVAGLASMTFAEAILLITGRSLMSWMGNLMV